MFTQSCISPGISKDIHFEHLQIYYNRYNEPYAELHLSYWYLDMHGLIIETSIWLLAGSTRFSPQNEN